MKTTMKRLDASMEEAMYHLAVYAFNQKMTVEHREEFVSLMDHSQVYGILAENELASQAFLTPLSMNFYGTKYALGKISEMSTFPEYRGEGFADRLIMHLLAQMHQQKMAIAYLRPHSYHFYREFGFEQAFEEIQYTMTPAEFPEYPKEAGRVKRISFSAALPLMKPLHAHHAANHLGAVVRPEWWWYYLANRNRVWDYAVYLNEAGQAEGYVIYSGSGPLFSVHEWLYESPQAFRALSRFITSHRSSFEKFRYLSADPQNHAYLLDENSIDVRILPGAMARIVDFETFIRKYPFRSGHDASFLLEVIDPNASWNAGLWQLEVERGFPTLKRVRGTEGTPDFSANIGRWTQILLGFRKVSDISGFGRMELLTQKQLDLEAVLPRKAPQLLPLD